MLKRLKYMVLNGILILSMLVVSCSEPAEQNEKIKNDLNKVNIKTTTISIYTAYMPKNEYKRIRKSFDEIEKRLSSSLGLRFDIKAIWDMPEIKSALRKRNISINEKDVSNIDVHNAIIDEFLKGDYPFDLLMYIAGGDQIDYTGKNQLIEKYIFAGKFMDITELMPQYAPEYYNSFSNDEIKSIMYNDSLYSIPSGRAASRPIIALTSRNLMDKYGIDRIVTFEDFFDYLKCVAENEKEFTPLGHFSSSCFWEFIAACDGYALIDGYMAYKVDDPEMEIVPFELTGSFREKAELFGMCAKNGYVYYDGAKKPASYIDEFPMGVPYPTLYENDVWVSSPLYAGAKLTNYPIYSVCYISAKSQNAKEILQFIEWVNSNADNFLLANYGFEGTDYAIENNKIIQKNSLSEIYQCTFRLPQKYELLEKFNMGIDRSFESYYSSSYPPHTGFTPDLSLREELAKRNEAFFNIIFKNLNNSDFYGSFDINELISEVKKLGTESMVKECQTQLDAWRNRNK